VDGDTGCMSAIVRKGQRVKRATHSPGLCAQLLSVSVGHILEVGRTFLESQADAQWHLLYKFSINPKTLARHLRSWLAPLGKEPFWHVAGISGCR
jgi:hypothetical protein